MHRRHAIKTIAALCASGAWPGATRAAAPAYAGRPRRFDYAWLKGRARAMAQTAYRPPGASLPQAVRDLDWDQYQAIRFRDSRALWAGDGLRFEVKFFHLGLYYKTPVRVHEVVDGVARELAYDPSMFDYGKSGLRPARLAAGLGFAGFRIGFHTDPSRDVAAFLGASYFRAVGGEMQYGQSARGLAIDSGMARAEEFPLFTAFWLERPAKDSGTLTVYALLDSPSVSGAYRFGIVPGATQVMDIDAALYPRREIERLGIAPLTSMFEYGENDRRVSRDWRPEIHDSDGLSMWTGRGEWIWRPLVNPGSLRFNAYADDKPRGYGLLQRDRNFDHYQDDGAFYERRPSTWVQPKHDWGKGSVQLVELPAADETVDNIVAFWNPERKPRPGEELLFGYRLYWGAKMPAGTPLARVVATYTGLGGVVGRKRRYFSWRFVVDFAGADFGMLGKDADVEAVIDASRGEIELVSARPLASIRGYRAMFDLRPADDGVEPINLRLYLSLDGQPLTETWLYQWTPPPPEKRRVARRHGADLTFT